MMINTNNQLVATKETSKQQADVTVIGTELLAQSKYQQEPVQHNQHKPGLSQWVGSTRSLDMEQR